MKPLTVLLIVWKKQKNHIEIFDDMDVFLCSYPRYNRPEVKESLAFGRLGFDDDEVHIEWKSIVMRPKPDFPRGFFWEFNYDTIDWQSSSDMVIQRILERGTKDHWQELIRYYGWGTIVLSLKQKITYLPDELIDETSLFFNIKKEEMLCYTRKRSQPTHWP